MKLSTIPLMLVAALSLAGCYSSLKGDTYSRSEAGKEQRVVYATVVQLRPVVIEGTKTPIGAVVGGVLGGIAGSAVGHGKGSEVGAVAGAAAGAAVGAVGEEQVTRSQGVEITIRYDDGREASIVQAASGEQFQINDRVRVLSGGERLRVSH